MKDQATKWRRWEKTRAMGETRFVWLVGVLGWGLLTATLVSGLMIGFRDRSMTIIPFAFVVFPIWGYFWGVRFWRVNEKQYAKDLGLPAPDS
jgi:hypothetical protein